MKRIIPLIVVLLIIGAGYYYWSQQRAGEKGPELAGSGTIEATQVEVTARIPGRILVIHAREGDRVTKDELLVELSHNELDRQLQQAQAAVEAAAQQVRLVRTNLTNARTERKRVRALHESGSVSRQKLDTVETAVKSLEVQRAGAAKLQEQAEAAVAFVESQIENAYLHCPLDGVVLTENLHVGENAFPGSSVLSLADLSDMWLTIYLPERLLGRVKLGMKARITADSYPDKTYEGRVSHISSEAEFTPKNVQTKQERVRLVYAVKIAVSDHGGELKIGMPADAELIEEAP